MKSFRTSNASPSASKLVTNVYLSSPLCTTTDVNLGASYSEKYIKKCQYEGKYKSKSKPKQKSMRKYLDPKFTTNNQGHLRYKIRHGVS